jgi:hypothetical protein
LDKRSVEKVNRTRDIVEKSEGMTIPRLIRAFMELSVIICTYTRDSRDQRASTRLLKKRPMLRKEPIENKGTKWSALLPGAEVPAESIPSVAKKRV